MANNRRRELEALLRSLRDGWTCCRSRRNSHWRITGPDGELIFASSTPSDPRALDNIRADLRRARALQPAQR